MLNDLANGEDHVFRPSFLSLLTVDLGPVLQLLRIANNLFAGNTRSYGRKAVEGLCISKLAARDSGWDLEIARTDVVTDCVAENVILPVVFGGVLAVLRDDDSELAFIVQVALAVFMNRDLVQRPSESIAGLHEDGWIGGYRELRVSVGWPRSEMG